MTLLDSLKINLRGLRLRLAMWLLSFMEPSDALVKVRRNDGAIEWDGLRITDGPDSNGIRIGMRYFHIVGLVGLLEGRR